MNTCIYIQYQMANFAAVWYMALHHVYERAVSHSNSFNGIVTN